MKPYKKDAAGWGKVLGFPEYENVTVLGPTGLAPGIEPRNERRFSRVSEDCALRNWYRVCVPGERDRYFYGETAWSDALRYAEDSDWRLIRREWETA